MSPKPEGRFVRRVSDEIDRVALRGVTDRPVFVGGSPRSGTTLLRTMLNAHPDLAMPRENRFLAQALELRRRFGDPSNALNREQLVNWIIHDRKSSFDSLELNADEAFERMMQAPGARLGSIMGTPLVMYSENNGATRWGDKRPAYIRKTGRIFTMFPDAQFVHLVRDPRGSAASMLKVGWFEGSAPKATELWIRSIEAAEVAKATMRSDQFYELRYEDLLADPAGEIDRLTSWLGLAKGGIPNMLDFHRDNDVPTSRYHWRVSEPLDQTAILGWKDLLDPSAVTLIEHVAATHMKRLGYETSLTDPAPDSDLLEAYKHRSQQKQARRTRPQRFDPAQIAALLTTAQRRRAKFMTAAGKVDRLVRR